jgi:copper resistance protein B
MMGIVSVFALTPAMAQDAPMDHSAHANPADAGAAPGANTPPPTPTDHAADAFYDPVVMASARKALYAENAMRAGALVLNLAEARFDAGTTWRLQGRGWTGGDVHRALLRVEGVLDQEGRVDHTRIEALYSRAVAPYWNLVAGVRADPASSAPSMASQSLPSSPQSPARTFLAFGIEGLAPYRIEIEATGYLSNHGEAEARIEAHTQLLLTRRLVLEPRATLDLSFSDVPERRLGSGIPNLELGLRLKWAQWRRFMPYLGAEWQGSFGNTARDIRVTGENPRALRFIAGFSAWL